MSRRKITRRRFTFIGTCWSLKEQAAFASEGGHVTILEVGAATLELTDSRHAEFIDEVEVGRRVAGHIRVAFKVDDSVAATEILKAAGARVLARGKKDSMEFYDARAGGAS